MVLGAMAVVVAMLLLGGELLELLLQVLHAGGVEGRDGRLVIVEGGLPIVDGRVVDVGHVLLALMRPPPVRSDHRLPPATGSAAAFAGLVHCEKQKQKRGQVR